VELLRRPRCIVDVHQQNAAQRASFNSFVIAAVDAAPGLRRADWYFRCTRHPRALRSWCWILLRNSGRSRLRRVPRLCLLEQEQLGALAIYFHRHATVQATDPGDGACARPAATSAPKSSPLWPGSGAARRSSRDAVRSNSLWLMVRFAGDMPWQKLDAVIWRLQWARKHLQSAHGPIAEWGH
jgi:hypothetical protein